jgi:hypothetical protein
MGSGLSETKINFKTQSRDLNVEGENYFQQYELAAAASAAASITGSSAKTKS